MAAIQLTKNELKKQRDSLVLFSRYLPTLQLKKQQLQTVLRRISEELENKRMKLEDDLEEIDEWVSVMGEPFDFEKYIVVKEVKVKSVSIGGIQLPVFDSVIYDKFSYDLFTVPLWADSAIDKTKQLKSQIIEIDILKKQYELLNEELTVTTQRVNLFEKVKIPQAKEIIRRVQIAMADQQTAAVVRGKISKRKLSEKKS
ncbi:MAG TPA: V-type ATP synthase subunit D [Chitinispirillaceae bacterium]|nr:V-type ATP synthase subunit D [Chitinispirillaceae bacterium]